MHVAAKSSLLCCNTRRRGLHGHFAVDVALFFLSTITTSMWIDVVLGDWLQFKPSRTRQTCGFYLDTWVKRGPPETINHFDAGRGSSLVDCGRKNQKCAYIPHMFGRAVR